MAGEDLLCMILVVVLMVFTYLAGRIDFLNVVVEMFLERAEQKKENEDE